ncbi:MAG: isopenicillin N synthase family oxygenase [Deltaproteobacteria bacterium]|nr:MAG: isopenicillin N synthase family oxygenase [Deltaproteobacteria bacterium]
MQSEIPVLDLHDLAPDAGPDAVKRAADALSKAFGTYGLVFIENHGIARDEVEALYDTFVDVLDRPSEEKASWGGEDIWYQRGWTPPNTEQAVVAGGQPDFKECFFAVGGELDERCKRMWPELYCDNVWPENADAFKEGTLAMSRAVHAIGLKLLRGCAVALDLPEDTFTSRVEGAASLSRILKYLELSESQLDTGILWGEEHTDFNLLTLLPGGAFFYEGQRVDTPPEGKVGLELRTRPTAEHPNGRLIAGRPPKGCIVAQVGQQLEVLTGGRFLATPHVIHAPGATGWTRTSFAHFVHLHGMVPVVPLEPFADADEDYAPPVLAGTYGLKTLIDIGLAPKSNLDRLGYRHYGRLADIRAREN